MKKILIVAIMIALSACCGNIPDKDLMPVQKTIDGINNLHIGMRFPDSLKNYKIDKSGNMSFGSFGTPWFVGLSSSIAEECPEYNKWEIRAGGFSGDCPVIKSLNCFICTRNDTIISIFIK
jgi:hypothetical protein